MASTTDNAEGERATISLTADSTPARAFRITCKTTKCSRVCTSNPACQLKNRLSSRPGYTHTHASKLTLTHSHSHTHTRTHSHSHTLTHTLTHLHTHILTHSHTHSRPHTFRITCTRSLRFAQLNGIVRTPHTRLQIDLAHSVFKAILKKSIPTQIRQLFLFIGNSRG